MKSSFFPYLSLAEKYFEAHGEPVTYRKRQLLVRRDESSKWVYFLKNGLIKVAFSLDDGTERLMGYFIPGMVFAQLGSFFAESPSGMEYEASADIQALRVPREKFLAELHSNSPLTQEYLDAMLRTQIFLIERLEYQGEKGIRYKYLKWLVFMAKYYGETSGNQCTVMLPLTQEAIASFLLSTRESASKATNDLQRKGLVSMKSKRLTILDLQKVKQLAKK